MRALVMLMGMAVVMAAQNALPPSGTARESVATVAVVTHPKGQPVLDLAPAQLTAEVDGQPARIAYIQAVGRALAMVLMFDVSASMFSMLGSAAEDFARRVPGALHSDDRVRFGEVGGQIAVGGITPHTREYFTGPPALFERPERDRRVERAFLTSPLWDAVAASVGAVRADERHRLVVLVTDGMVTGSRLGVDEAIGLAAAAQTTVSVIDMHNAAWMTVEQDNQKARAEFRPDRALRRLAAGTAGSYFAEMRARGITRFRAPRFSDMPELVAQAITESRGAYRLGLEIPADGAPHSVRITSSRSGLVIRTPPILKRGN